MLFFDFCDYTRPIPNNYELFYKYIIFGLKQKILENFKNYFDSFSFRQIYQAEKNLGFFFSESAEDNFFKNFLKASKNPKFIVVRPKTHPNSSTTARALSSVLHSQIQSQTLQSSHSPPESLHRLVKFQWSCSRWSPCDREHPGAQSDDAPSRMKYGQCPWWLRGF